MKKSGPNKEFYVIFFHNFSVKHYFYKKFTVVDFICALVINYWSCKEIIFKLIHKAMNIQF